MKELILIIEDEHPAFEKLTALLSETTLEFDYHWAKNNREVKKQLENNLYSLIISDVQLGNNNVFDVLSDHFLKTPIIFCTAYHEYLLQAFQENGIAYLLKPYDLADLEKALAKYQVLFDKITSAANPTLLHELEKSSSKSGEYQTRFAVKNVKKEITLVPISEISLIESKGDFCKIITQKSKHHSYTETLGGIERKLDPQFFFRTSRSHIININAIVKIQPYFKNRLSITLKGTDLKVTTSSSRTADFRIWIEG